MSSDVGVVSPSPPYAVTSRNSHRSEVGKGIGGQCFHQRGTASRIAWVTMISHRDGCPTTAVATARAD